MEEDPRDHDFDQRHDGPFDRPSLHIRRRSSAEAQSPSGPVSPMEAGDYNPTSPVGRRSMQSARAVGRNSTQFTRATSQGRHGRSSQDFDNRRDGPYGRPSLTMSRRKSSGTPLPMSLSPEGRPSLPKVHVDGVVESNEESHAPDEQIPTSLDTLQSSDPAFEPEPPPLNYTLWVRKWSIIFFWGLIIVDCVFMPIALYFGLWYGTNLTPNIVFSIVTAALGGVSILEYVIRFKRLVQKSSTCRVIGARRAYLDWFHWNFSLGWVVIMVELIIGTIPENPPIRLLAMPVTSMLYAFGTEMLLVDLLRYFEVPAPVRISSIPKGSQLRPGIYSVIEDVCAVDGSGGTAFREALNKRYEASHTFRAMLRRLGFFWAIGAETAAVVLTILIFTLPGEAAYVVGWAVPFIWAGVWTGATIWYVKKSLRAEQIAWEEEIAAKSAA